MDYLERLIKEKLAREAQAKTRRHFIKECATGLGGIALSSILMGCDPLGSNTKNPILRLQNGI